MRIRRLGWAGAEIEHGGDTLLIDYVLETAGLPLRDENTFFPPASRPKSAVVGLLTHLHGDHADAAALAEALRPGAPVFRPAAATGAGSDLELTAPSEAGLNRSLLNARVVEPWTRHEAGLFVLQAVPAVDGFGDLQISWVIECGGKRIIHAGDTLFHGYWWRIARRFGPFDLAFLPINGAVVDFPFLQPPRNQEAVMTPEEAVKAACMLGARTIVPIHYDALHQPPLYNETRDPLGRLRAAAGTLGIEVQVYEPGHWFDLG